MDTNVSFDDEGRIRVLDADKFEKAFLLQTECTEFATSKSSYRAGPFVRHRFVFPLASTTNLVPVFILQNCKTLITRSIRS